MDDWSSFTEDKDFADAWRQFLEEKEDPNEPEGEESKGDESKGDEPKGDKPSRLAQARGAAGSIGKGLGKAYNLAQADLVTRGYGASAKRALRGARGISFAKASRGASTAVDAAPGEVPAETPVETPSDSETSTGERSPAYEKFKGYIKDVANGEMPLAAAVQQAYQDLTDEEKDEFEDFFDQSAVDNPGIAAYFTPVLGGLKEQYNLSLEELIKEELLRVLNEEE